jgi:plastocyanin
MLVVWEVRQSSVQVSNLSPPPHTMFRSLASLAFVALFTSATAQNILEVSVSNDQGELIYSPAQVTASPGDTVHFTFQSGNHTVSQSSIINPCYNIYEGFDSGLCVVMICGFQKFLILMHLGSRPVSSEPGTANPSFDITVNDDQPVCIFCRQGQGTNASHCNQGMVMAINDDGAYPYFLKLAKGGKSFNPG